MAVIVPDGNDIDSLGTFPGEVERRGSPREVALEKTRLGLQAANVSIGIASEGSFGPDMLVREKAECADLSQAGRWPAKADDDV